MAIPPLAEPSNEMPSTLNVAPDVTENKLLGCVNVTVPGCAELSCVE